MSQNYLSLFKKAFPQFDWIDERTPVRRINLMGRRKEVPGTIDGIQTIEEIRYQGALRAEGLLTVTHLLKAKVSANQATEMENRAIDQLRAWMPEGQLEHSSINHVLGLIRNGFFTERQLAHLARDQTSPLDVVLRDYILERFPRIRVSVEADYWHLVSPGTQGALTRLTGEPTKEDPDPPYRYGIKFREIGFIEIEFFDYRATHSTLVSLQWVPWQKARVTDLIRSEGSEQLLRKALNALDHITDGLLFDDLRSGLKPDSDDDPGPEVLGGHIALLSESQKIQVVLEIAGAL